MLGGETTLNDFFEGATEGIDALLAALT